VHGFAEQRLQKVDTPVDLFRRRISLIDQHLERPTSSESSAEGGE